MKSEEIVLLHWTTGKGHKKGEIAVQSDGIYVYKTKKFILRNVTDYREIVYAEIPFDVIEEITLFKKGLMKNNIVRLKISKKHFHELLEEKHSGLFKHLVKLFNKDNYLYFQVYRNTTEDVQTFINVVKERL